MRRLWTDLLHAHRGAVRNPRFVVLAVAIFALAIGANATIYTLVDRLFLANPAHVAAPGDLVQIGRTEADRSGFRSFAYPDYQWYRDHSESFVSLLAYDDRLEAVRLQYAAQDGATRSAQFVSWNYFSTLGTRPAAGRWFTVEEERVDDPTSVVVLSEARATELFGTVDRSVGEVVTLNGHPFTVVGVAPVGFHGINPLQATPDLWIPITTYARVNPQFGELALRRTPGNTWTWLNLVGRLAPEAGVDTAQLEMTRMASYLEQEFAEWNEGWGAVVQPGVRLDPGQRAETLSLARLLALGVGLVLLIALLNVAILFGARVEARQRELRVRLAIGAGRRRLRRLLVFEGVLVSVAGAAVGFGVAHLATGLVAEVFPYRFDQALRPHGGVLLFSLILAAASGTLVGWASSRGTVNEILRRSLARHDQIRSHRGRWLLISLQVAVATVLVVCGTLTTRSLLEARSLDLGFESRGVRFVSVAPRNHGYEDEAADAFNRSTLAALAATPGFDRVSATRMIPFRGSWTSSMVPEGHEQDGEDRFTALFNAVAPGYFGSLEVPLLAGRDFASRDGVSAPQVAIVNRAFVDRYWPGEDGVGKTISQNGPIEVVGVVETATYGELGEEPRPHVFRPLDQFRPPSFSYVISSRLGTAELQRLAETAIASVDPSVAVRSAVPLGDILDRELGRYRTGATMIGLFAVLALVLAAAGLYATLTYQLVQQLREVGIRMAIGAEPRHVASCQLRRALSPVVAGLLLGMLGALAAARLLSGLLFGIEPLDPASYTATLIILLAASAAAAVLPVSRALRVDPVEVLRAD